MNYDMAANRSRLEARLETLEERLAEIHDTLREPEDDDLEEQAVDWDDDEVLQRLPAAGRDELATRQGCAQENRPRDVRSMSLVRKNDLPEEASRPTRNIDLLVVRTTRDRLIT